MKDYNPNKEDLNWDPNYSHLKWKEREVEGEANRLHLVGAMSPDMVAISRSEYNEMKRLAMLGRAIEFAFEYDLTICQWQYDYDYEEESHPYVETKAHDADSLLDWYDRSTRPLTITLECVDADLEIDSPGGM